jgi:hypothetical protein
MSIYGLILMIVGIVFELCFVMASLGRGKVSPIAFGVAAFLIVTGYRIRRRGARPKMRVCAIADRVNSNPLPPWMKKRTLPGEVI